MVGYDARERLFLVQWRGASGAHKWVSRFNLRVAGEEPGGPAESAWLARQRNVSHEVLAELEEDEGPEPWEVMAEEVSRRAAEARRQAEAERARREARSP